MKILVHSAPEALGCEETSFLGFLYPGNDVTEQEHSVGGWRWDSVNGWNYIIDHHPESSKGGWVS